jgi:UDP-N-acetylglucosamine--N-acetylmuramyl-(pentapeptide) pyrophosphoryl-undecaprenol N-acetylglucosamine transferase
MRESLPGGTDLLVASAGGHLQQLLTLRNRWRPSAQELWVSYETSQTRSLLDTAEVLFAHHPTTKNIPNALRNYRLARRLFAQHRIERVISTGAAVAVPFMIRARQLGIPCHYIESATRVEGPSLSGRILARTSGVRLYRQLGDWGGPRWQKGASVFDGFEVVAASASPPVERVLASFGTHRFGFPSLLERLGRIVPPGPEVTWQLGSTPPAPGLTGRAFDQLAAHELSRLVARVDVVVGHAGVGLVLTSLAAGKVPVLVPRRRSRGEHTDDHQVQLAKALDEMGLAVTAEVGELSLEHLERASSLRVIHREPPPFTFVD